MYTDVKNHADPSVAVKAKGWNSRLGLSVNKLVSCPSPYVAIQI